MNENEVVTPTPETSAAGKLRKAGFIYRIAAGVFALTATIYAVNSFRHEDSGFDISMSVLQFALAIVFFLVGGICYRKARGVPPLS